MRNHNDPMHPIAPEGLQPLREAAPQSPVPLNRPVIELETQPTTLSTLKPAPPPYELLHLPPEEIDMSLVQESKRMSGDFDLMLHSLEEGYPSPYIYGIRCPVTEKFLGLGGKRVHAVAQFAGVEIPFLLYNGSKEDCLKAFSRDPGGGKENTPAVELALWLCNNPSVTSTRRNFLNAQGVDFDPEDIVGAVIDPNLDVWAGPKYPEIGLGALLKLSPSTIEDYRRTALDLGTETLGLLPGTRMYDKPGDFKALRSINRRNPELLRFLLGLVKALDAGSLQELLRKASPLFVTNREYTKLPVGDNPYDTVLLSGEFLGLTGNAQAAFDLLREVLLQVPLVPESIVGLLAPFPLQALPMMRLYELGFRPFQEVFVGNWRPRETGTHLILLSRNEQQEKISSSYRVLRGPWQDPEKRHIDVLRFMSRLGGKRGIHLFHTDWDHGTTWKEGLTGDCHWDLHNSGLLSPNMLDPAWWPQH